MTRKRFVKLLMAEGYSRNSANKIAQDVLADGMTYAEGFDQVTRMLPVIQEALQRMSEAIQPVVDAIWKTSCALVEAVKAFSDTFLAEMGRT